MPLTSRERVLAIINHETPDRVPIVIGACNAASWGGDVVKSGPDSWFPNYHPLTDTHSIEDLEKYPCHGGCRRRVWVIWEITDRFQPDETTPRI